MFIEHMEKIGFCIFKCQFKESLLDFPQYSESKGRDDLKEFCFGGCKPASQWAETRVTRLIN